MKIMPNRLDRGFIRFQEEFEAKALQVLRSGWYILGDEVKHFEEEFARYTGAKHCVSLASGLDALWIACRALGIGKGDEVIVQANTYIASVMAISVNGATPVFVEPDECYGIDPSRIEEKITPKTKAIMAVHLYGQACQMNKIEVLAQKYGLKLIEDCAQSHGATFDSQTTGTFGHIGCFSFYPSKNLGAFGDGGAIVTNDDKIADYIRIFRNYGSEKKYYNRMAGTNSRLDELQAGLLRVRLAHLDELNSERQKIAERYTTEITNPKIECPKVRPAAIPVFHQYVIRCKERNRLVSYLDKQDIGTLIHYPIPPHLSEAYAYLGCKKGDFPISEEYADTVLSIPMYNGMTDEEQTTVIRAINQF